MATPKNWLMVISMILEESGSRNGSLTGLTEAETLLLSKKLNDLYILNKRDDIHHVVFNEGAIPPEGVLITK
ncbi:uncharacterized protein METZ01_LOCUS407826 [marine metagenome]|uniref:Uncharacterized protein n=1 Tax=marine metagenome TaxID=408172 RepID=A0A382W834_9ZZZZ